MLQRALQLLRVHILMSTAALAQTVAPLGELSLSLDHARFRQDAQSGYFEVYYSFLPALLTFEFVEGKYQGGVDLSTRILDRTTLAPAAEKKTPLQIAEADTSGAWYRFPFITQTGFQLPLGRYRLEVSAVDAKAPARKIEVQADFEITPFPATAALSDLELCKKIAPSQNRGDPFYKNTLEVVPQPSALFGVTTSPVVFHYAELYGLSPAETYFLKAQFLDGDGNLVYEKSEEKKYAATTAVAAGNKMVTSLPTGKYTLRCLLLDAGRNELSRSEKVLYILNPHVKPRQIDAMTVLSKEMESFSAQQLDEEFQHLRYLTTGEENKIYSQVTTLEGKREFLLKVWKEAELGRGDKPGVLRSEYQQRIKLATEQFTALGKEGWRTDRGRVLVLYGPPDERQRAVPETGSKGYEIWKYFQLDSGVEFVFIDRTGYGDFQLVHSTKRGELKDYGWESLLQ
jgi:GWxTD domain-containing protein